MTIVLKGHTTPETAYTVQDYPYGFRLRCKIRYWLETAVKGSKSNEMRFMSQTTDPRRSAEVWNKPKASNYYQMMIMFLNEDNHVKNGSLDINSNPEKFTEWQKDLFSQFDADQQKRFNMILKVSKKLNPTMWARYEEQNNVNLQNLQNPNSFTETEIVPPMLERPAPV